MKKRYLALIVVIALVVPLILAACQTSAGGSKPVTQNLSIMMGEGTMIHELENGEEELTGEFHRWEPAVLMAFTGDTIILTVTNPHPNAHSFMLPEFGVITPLLEPQGGTAVVEFTVDEAGIFQFACGLPYDNEAGYCAIDHEHMVGYLTVLER